MASRLRLRAIATAAGHDLGGAANVAWLGEDGLKARRERARAARALFERTREVVTVPAVDKDRTDVGMPGEFVWSWYQPWADRGVWENRCAVMSGAALFEVDVTDAARRRTTPWLTIRSDDSFLPEFARERHESAVDAPEKLIREGATAHGQRDEDPAVLDRTVEAITDWYAAQGSRRPAFGRMPGVSGVRRPHETVPRSPRVVRAGRGDRPRSFGPAAASASLRWFGEPRRPT